MDNKAYLEQISSEARPLKPTKSLFGFNISPKMLKIIIGIVVATVIIMIFGGILSSLGNKNSERDYLDKIYIRTDNLMVSISNYNNLVKSSELRSMGNSLNAVLVQTNYEVLNYLKENYELTNYKPEKEQTLTDENTYIEELNQSLENGRLNGILDRTYAREFTYEIGMLLSLESEAIANTKNENLKSILNSSHTNLEQLYPQFNNFTSK